MRDTIKKLREERAKTIADMRKILDNAGTRALRAEEEDMIAKHEAAIADHDKRIGALERSLELESEKDTGENGGTTQEGQERSVQVINGRRVVTVGADAAPQRRNNDGASEGQPTRWITEDDQQYRNRCRRTSAEYRAEAIRYMLTGKPEFRAVQADIDYLGGYLVMPQQFVQTLLKFTDNYLFIRQLATKYQVANAQSLGVPTLDTDPDDSDWTSELSTGNLDSAAAVGKRELVPYPLAKRLKMSNKLLRLASINSTFAAYNDQAATGPIENFLASRLAYKTAVAQEKAFMIGNGQNQPLGLFTASSRGISTARDVSTGSATGFSSGDCLIAAKYSIKQPYHKNLRWLLSRSAVSKIRQLKDNQGRYIWEPGLQIAAPDKLLDVDITMSEYCPNAFTTGTYCGMIADFSFYWIADSLEYQIQKLSELYAEQNQTGFIVRCELDGMPVLEEAFARLITA